MSFFKALAWSAAIVLGLSGTAFSVWVLTHLFGPFVGMWPVGLVLFCVSVLILMLL